MKDVLIGKEKDFVVGKGYVINIDNEEILVYRGKNSFFALINECSHEKFPLSDGIINEEKCSITCIHHGAKFSLNDGSVLSFPATLGIKVYKVYIKDNDVYIRC